MTTSVESPKQEKGTASNEPVPFNASAMVEVLGKAYMNIAEASGKALPLHAAFIREMQEAQGYDAADGVTVLKDVNGVVSGVTFEGTFYNVKAALNAKYLTPVKAEPSPALVKAVDALSGAVKEFNNVVAEATRPLLISVPKGKKNVNMPSGTRQPSKGFISADEWAAIPSSERAEFNMSYDGTGITLEDVNGEEHYCKAIGALKRHENGEGHKK